MALRYDDDYDLSSIGAHWGRVPAHHHGAPNPEGRRILHAPGRRWARTPEDCDAGMLDSEGYGPLVICLRCGIDAT